MVEGLCAYQSGGGEMTSLHILGHLDHHRITIDDTISIFQYLYTSPIYMYKSTFHALRLCHHFTSHRSSPLQTSTRTLTTKNAHNAKSHIKQSQRIRHQPPHTAHPPHSAKHLTTTIRAPHNRQRTQYITHRRIHRQQDAHETSQHKRQQTISQHGR